MATFTLPGGGSLAADALKAAQASTATPINEIVLGDTSGGGTLGPQPLSLTGGGQPLFGPQNVSADFTLSGGGALTFAGPQHLALTGTFILSGGGAATFAGPHRKSFALHGGGATTGSGQRITLNALLVPCAELLLDLYPLYVGTPPPPPVPGLYVTLLDDSLDTSPGTLTAIVGNGTPFAAALFAIDGHLRFSSTFDDAGAIGGISVPVSVTVDGTHDLTVTDDTTSAAATVTFTVAAISTAATIGAPVTTPPSNVQPGSGVKKWVFQDPANSEVYHFAINPNKMNSPFPPKRIVFQATTAIDGARLAFEGQPTPTEWQFEGTLFAQAQYDALRHWFGKRNRIWVTDHYGRAWLCYLTVYQPIPRRSHEFPWCHDWSMTALIFEGPVTPT